MAPPDTFLDSDVLPIYRQCNVTERRSIVSTTHEQQHDQNYQHHHQHHQHHHQHPDQYGDRSRGRSRGVPGEGPFEGLAAFGPFGPGGGPRGFGRPYGRRGGGRRGGRGGRGDVRAAILLLLAEQPMHGYELIQQIQDKSGGVWVPSPGSVYPALQQLEDERLVAFDRVEGRKTASLTEQGRAYVEEHRAELGAPWDDVSGGVTGEARELHKLVGALIGAVHTVGSVGSRDQVRQAAEVLDQARKSLYRILAEDSDR
jgi:DNA-binding PadR family transcriptional regulator